MDVSRVIEFITHRSLKTYKPRGSKASLPKQHEAYKQDFEKRGVVFVSPSKEDLMQGKGHIVTSYETLHTQSRQLTHWTPNTFLGGTYIDFKERIIQGHTKENLKQINAFVVDIDTKNTDLFAFFLACEEEGLPAPNAILETPRGYQFYFVLETPMFLTKASNYQVLKVADRIVANIKEALASHVPIDPGCNPFGFYRIPNPKNILYFDDQQTTSAAAFIEWSKAYEKRKRKGAFHVVYAPNQNDQIHQEWYRALLNSTHIEQGHYMNSRNNALLTLAIANYASGRTYEAAFNELDQFNSQLENPMSPREFTRTMKSAYSGRYKGAKKEYIQGLIGQWTDQSINLAAGQGWYKFKKAREDRERSHYDEWEQDILDYLKVHTSSEKELTDVFICDSQVKLAERLGMAVSSLKEVFKRSKKLMKVVKGKGRGQKTYIASREVLFKCFLQLRKKLIRDGVTWRSMYQAFLFEDQSLEYVFKWFFLPFEEWVIEYEKRCRTPMIC
ncbi:primase C-terminal domain-containing protein [Halobacillus sp. Marseille-Q1614]|uniref:primase C-terminal domain-containing protein n=1 Tax=Halobacillus sp. Marseille-Q1614 TaxID=2709134 RepID=UPI00156E3EDD|nr:primase C-terminal domain-containing protein [Halobacillus sp. Marseille-Q1614]